MERKKRVLPNSHLADLVLGAVNLDLIGGKLSDSVAFSFPALGVGVQAVDGSDSESSEKFHFYFSTYRYISI
jgi:hypothetical protein